MLGELSRSHESSVLLLLQLLVDLRSFLGRDFISLAMAALRNILIKSRDNDFSLLRFLPASL
jgi:hypothetical protein